MREIDCIYEKVRIWVCCPLSGPDGRMDQDTDPNSGARARAGAGCRWAALRSRAAGWCLQEEQSRQREGPAEAWRVATSVAVRMAARMCTEQRGGPGAELGRLWLSPQGAGSPQGCEAGTGVLRFALVTVSLTDSRAADRCWWAEGGPGRPILKLFQRISVERLGGGGSGRGGSGDVRSGCLQLDSRAV